MKIEKVKLSDLNSPSWNPRYITDEDFRKLKNSIETFGYVDPIIVNKYNMNIVGGNQRYQALKKLGYETIDVVFIDEPNLDKEKALNISLNKISGDWDTEKLNTLLEEIKLSEVDVTLTGFDDTEIKEFDDLMEFNDYDENSAEETTNESNSFEKNDDIFYFPKEEIMDDIVKYWKRYDNLDEFVENIIDIPSAKHQFNRLCQGYNKEGYNISLLFNPHRLLIPTWKEKGIFYGFQDDEKYKKQFARYLVNINNKVQPYCLYHRHMGLGHKGYMYVQEFPPYIARDIYKRYCSDGDKILNPCGGWGGRLIGLASCMWDNIEYWETEPSTKTYNGLVKLKEFLNLNDNYKQFNVPFEKLKIPKEYFDFVFTSPPYFDTERYSEEETQSYVGKESYEEWRDDFLYVMLDKIVYGMKSNSSCLLNIGKNRFPMDIDIKDYLKNKYDISSYFVDEYKQRLDINNDGTNKEEKRYERHNGGEVFIEFRKT